MFKYNNKKANTMNKDVVYLDSISLKRLKDLISEKRSIKAVNPSTNRKVSLYSQEKLAEVSGTGTDHLNCFLNGKRGLGMEKLKRLLEYLEVDYDWVVGKNKYRNEDEHRCANIAMLFKTALMTKEQVLIGKIIRSFGYSCIEKPLVQYMNVYDSEQSCLKLIPCKDFLGNEIVKDYCVFASPEGNTAICESSEYTDFLSDIEQQLILQTKQFFQRIEANQPITKEPSEE